MKHLLNENDKSIGYVIRVMGGHWTWIREIVEEGLDLFDPCNYEKQSEYLEMIVDGSAETYLLNFFDSLDSEPIQRLKEHIKKDIHKGLGYRIITHYKDFKIGC